jgi:hypothetical protein
MQKAVSPNSTQRVRLLAKGRQEVRISPVLFDECAIRRGKAIHAPRRIRNARSHSDAWWDFRAVKVIQSLGTLCVAV